MQRGCYGMSLYLVQPAPGVQRWLDETYLTLLVHLDRWIRQHGEAGTANPGLARLAQLRGSCIGSVCAQLAVLRACGLVERVGRRGWWDAGAQVWHRVPDSYRLTQAGKDVVKRGTPLQQDALARLVRNAPRRRGCPSETWQRNLVQGRQDRLNDSRLHDAAPERVREVVTEQQRQAARQALRESSAACLTSDRAPAPPAPAPAAAPAPRTWSPPPELVGAAPDPIEVHAAMAALRIAAGLTRPPT